MMDNLYLWSEIINLLDQQNKLKVRQLNSSFKDIFEYKFNISLDQNNIYKLQKISNNITFDVKAGKYLNDHHLFLLLKKNIITGLDLGDNISITGKGLDALPNLKSLSINNRIMNDDIIKLTNLTKLELSNNSIITDDGMRNMYNLTYLDSKFSITNISHLTNLETLYIYTGLVDSLPYLTKLKILSIDSELIIDKHLENLINLEELEIENYVEGSKITNESISNFTKLKKLKLWNCFDITNNGLTKLTNITELDITITSDKINMDSISRLKMLLKLNIYFDSKNKIMDVNKIRCLTRLRYLTGYNVDLNNNIKYLTKLNFLYLESSNVIFESKMDNLINVEICEESTVLGLEYLTSLTKLQIYNSESSQTSLKYLTNLTILICDLNITEYEIKHLTKLTILRLYSSIQLEHNEIKYLTNLTELSLSKSNITDDDLKYLINLTNLDLEESNISDDSLKYLTNLSSLHIKTECGLITDESLNCLMKLNFFEIELSKKFDTIKVINKNKEIKYIKSFLKEYKYILKNRQHMLWLNDMTMLRKYDNINVTCSPNENNCMRINFRYYPGIKCL
jgi:hypothetical protein